MDGKTNEDNFIHHMREFSSQFVGTSLAIVAIFIIIIYEFNRNNLMTETFNWIYYMHLGISSSLLFFLTSSIQLFKKIKFFNAYHKLFDTISICLFVMGWFILFSVLVILYLETLAS